jgi:hypothetical protein
MSALDISDILRGLLDVRKDITTKRSAPFSFACRRSYKDVLEEDALVAGWK